jgi:hypothetical protein
VHLELLSFEAPRFIELRGRRMPFCQLDASRCGDAITVASKRPFAALETKNADGCLLEVEQLLLDPRHHAEGIASRDPSVDTQNRPLMDG